MKEIIEILVVVGFMWGFIALCLCATYRKKTPKQPAPGEDFDERGPYENAVNRIQTNVNFDVRKFLKKVKP